MRRGLSSFFLQLQNHRGRNRAMMTDESMARHPDLGAHLFTAVAASNRCEQDPSWALRQTYYVVYTHVFPSVGGAIMVRIDAWENSLFSGINQRPFGGRSGWLCWLAGCIIIPHPQRFRECRRTTHAERERERKRDTGSRGQWTDVILHSCSHCRTVEPCGWVSLVFLGVSVTQTSIGGASS